MMTTRTLERVPDPPAEEASIVSRVVPMMGGAVGIHIVPGEGSSPFAAATMADATLRRMDAWAGCLTRFTETSELSRLNRDPRTDVPVGPTLTAVLDWGREAETLTGGVVDIGLLDERLAAEGLAPDRRPSPASRSWSLVRGARGAVVRRPVGLRFDLDGVGKGWLADRALSGLAGHAAAVVDADGDVAVHLEAGTTWSIGVADPRLDGYDLAVVRLAPRGRGSRRDGLFGVATSGTSVHRWARGDQAAHHLIDPTTGSPAVTDVIQATVLTTTARRAEALAKAVVILGSGRGFALLDRVGVDGAMVLTTGAAFHVHPSTRRWLA
jgi:thiamine biosynthesis lipoprotein